MGLALHSRFISLEELPDPAQALAEGRAEGRRPRSKFVLGLEDRTVDVGRGHEPLVGLILPSHARPPVTLV